MNLLEAVACHNKCDRAVDHAMGLTWKNIMTLHLDMATALVRKSKSSPAIIDEAADGHEEPPGCQKS